MRKADLEGKKIVVTGASSGVGRQTAILLSQMGAKVCILARREEELKKTMAMMSGEGHSYKVVDLSDFDRTVEIFNTIVADDNVKLDGVVHSAAIVKVMPLRKINLINMESIFKTNVYSFAAILKCVASRRIFNDGGSVVAVSSYVAVGGQSGNAIYGASKGAMNALVKTAAKELRTRHIRVNAICPSGIYTEMVFGQSESTTDSSVAGDSASCLMKPGKVASVILSLLSDGMEYVSGGLLDVDRAGNWEG